MSDNTLNAFELAIELSGEPRLNDVNFTVGREHYWDGSPAQSISFHPRTQAAVTDVYRSINEFIEDLTWVGLFTWVTAETGNLTVTIHIPKDTTPGTLGQQFLDAQQVAA